MIIRIDKYLADSGYGTRSEVHSLVRSGSVLVNGDIVKQIGLRIDTDRDQICVRGKVVSYSEFEYYMLHKPAGIISASSDRSEKTVVDLIKSRKRRDLFPVGRLDRDTEGLLLITNDGEMSHRLLSPAMHISKTYGAIISGRLPDDAVDICRTGIDIGDEKLTRSAELRVLQPEEIYDDIFRDRLEAGLTPVMITLTEGRYHEIKRMFEAIGCLVEYLKRYSMGSLTLDSSLQPGEYRELTAEELDGLRHLCDKDKKHP